MDSDVLWTSGEDISSLDRGYQYGDGVFETLLVHQGSVWLEHAHLRRLAWGCQQLGIAYVENDVQSLLTEARHACGHNAGIIKVILTRGAGARGYRPSAATSKLWGAAYKAARTPLANPAGVTLNLCSLRLANQSRLAGIKHLNRLEQVLAAAELPEDAFDGVMLDIAGNVIETTFANLFCYRANHWYTPKLDTCGVAGVCREWLLQHLDCRITQLTLDELVSAEEVFICNSVMGLRPVAVLRLTNQQVTFPSSIRTLAINQNLLHSLPGGGS